MKCDQRCHAPALTIRATLAAILPSLPGWVSSNCQPKDSFYPLSFFCLVFFFFLWNKKSDWYVFILSCSLRGYSAPQTPLRTALGWTLQCLCLWQVSAWVPPPQAVSGITWSLRRPWWHQRSYIPLTQGATTRWLLPQFLACAFQSGGWSHMTPSSPLKHGWSYWGMLYQNSEREESWDTGQYMLKSCGHISGNSILRSLSLPGNSRQHLQGHLLTWALEAVCPLCIHSSLAQTVAGPHPS